MKPHSSFAFVFFLLTNVCLAQDSVDVIFRFKPPFFTTSYLVGEFNGWKSGDSAFAMNYQGDFWTLTTRLRIGGNPSPPSNGVPGAWQYKFYYKDASPWPNDSLDHHVNSQDNDNSFIYTKDPTIYQLLPNQRNPIVRTRTPTITAYIFPKVGASIDTSKLMLNIDGVTFTGIGSSYNFSTKQFLHTVQTPLANGSHTVILTAGSSAGGMNSDTVTFITQAGFVQISTRGGYATRNPQRVIRGIIQDTTIHSLRLVRNNIDTTSLSVSDGLFSATLTLVEGGNSINAIVDSGGKDIASDPVSFSYIVNHAPTASIAFISIGSQIILSAQASSDPDSGQTSQLTFQWSADTRNPQAVSITNAASAQATIPNPSVSGEYYFTLIATDPNGNRDTTRNFFAILKDGSFQSSTLASVPSWVRQGRTYELFFKSLTPAGTISAALPYLPYFKSLGVNILWVMPIMENAAPINNGTGPGYNITNFSKVAPEYGTNDDFKNFVRQAHHLGLKVILDVTPNHTSYAHRFALDARAYKEDSFYWNFYEHRKITDNTNNLGDCLTSDGFNYYCGFSDQLLNYNWSDIDARFYMTDVYKWWIKEFDIDGFRFDVYWGPRRRYGEQVMGAPLRRTLKHIKPDIFLLAEDDGTGPGTEVIYADRNGGVDAGYDWRLYWDAIEKFYGLAGVEELNDRLTNNGFYPGTNSVFLRFLENHDEERIVVKYGSYEKSMPIATAVFMGPGLPMIYSGQEVGHGFGLSNFFERTRGVINWNSSGKSLLQPHYQRLAHIRSGFDAFWSQNFVRLSTGKALVYSYFRPHENAEGIVTVNMSSTQEFISLSIASSQLKTTIQEGKVYFASDVYNDTTYTVTFADGFASLPISIKSYGSSVIILSDSIHRVGVPQLTSVDKEFELSNRPERFRLHQNYPNPFNPSTMLTYELPSEVFVTLKIYNVLGKEIATLVELVQRSGVYTVRWDGATNSHQQVSSGVYFARLASAGWADTKKIILLR